jgi:hypothetical protein
MIVLLNKFWRRWTGGTAPAFVPAGGVIPQGSCATGITMNVPSISTGA